MRIKDVRERGQAMGMVGLERMRMGDLIRAIQKAEGNSDCYGAAWRFDCLQTDCCWRQDCLKQKPG